MQFIRFLDTSQELDEIGEIHSGFYLVIANIIYFLLRVNGIYLYAKYAYHVILFRRRYTFNNLLQTQHNNKLLCQ